MSAERSDDSHDVPLCERGEAAVGDIAFLERVMRFQDGALTSEQLAAFEAELRVDTGKLRAFVELQVRSGAIHDALRRQAFANDEASSFAASERVVPPSGGQSLVVPRAIRKWVFLAVVLGLLVALWNVGGWRHVATGLWPPKEVAPAELRLRKSEAAFVRLVRTSDVRWEGDALKIGDRLQGGRVRLADGTAEFSFDNDVRMVLSGPAEVELRDAMHAWLHSGQVMFHVPPAATGFTVETTEAEIVDLGTEFGVEVASQGGCLLQVYEGEVMASAKLDATETVPRRILQGEAVRVDNVFHKTDFWPERFVRLLPGPDDPAGRGKYPYNVSRLSSVQIVPAPTDVIVDGDLSDWNLAGRFRSACEAPYAENYYLDAAMMYDDRTLYIGAHVGDPFPLRSQTLPTDSVDRHGSGGAVALRISTDRQAGWPLSAVAENERQGRPATPADLSDKLSFVVLWFSEPVQEACIHLRHGMDLHGLQVNPPGYQGAYRKDADGRGYTLEYAIPWNLLNAAEDPPRAGDELAAMWLVHWSDPAGRNWQGQLNDVMKPNEPGWNFLRAATWGKAIYVRNP